MKKLEMNELEQINGGKGLIDHAKGILIDKIIEIALDHAPKKSNPDDKYNKPHGGFL